MSIEILQRVRVAKHQFAIQFFPLSLLRIDGTCLLCGVEFKGGRCRLTEPRQPQPLVHSVQLPRVDVAGGNIPGGEGGVGQVADGEEVVL